MPTRLVQIPNAPQTGALPGMARGTGASEIPNLRAPKPSSSREAMAGIRDLSDEVGAAYARVAKSRSAPHVDAGAMSAPARAMAGVGRGVSEAGALMTRLGDEIIDAHNTAVRVEYETDLSTQFAEYQASLEGREDFEDWASGWEKQSEEIYRSYAGRTKGGRGLDNLSMVRMKAEGSQQASLIKTAASQNFNRARDRLSTKAETLAMKGDFMGAAAVWRSPEADKYFYPDEKEAGIDRAEFKAGEQRFANAVALDPAGVVDDLEKNDGLYFDQDQKLEKARQAMYRRGGREYDDIAAQIRAGELDPEKLKMRIEATGADRYLSDGQKASLNALMMKSQPDSSEDFNKLWRDIDEAGGSTYDDAFSHDKHFQELKERMDAEIGEGRREILHERWNQARKNSDPVEQQKTRNKEVASLAKERKKSVTKYGTQTFDKLGKAIFGDIDKEDSFAILSKEDQTAQFYSKWSQFAEEHKELDPGNPDDLKVIRDQFFRLIKETTGKDMNLAEREKSEGIMGRFWKNLEQSYQKSQDVWRENPEDIENRVRSAQDRLKTSSANSQTVTPTFYSIGKSVGGTDETQDKWTNRGYTRTGKNLSWGAVAVGSPSKVGTVFKDLNTGDVFIATDYHGNKNREVFDYYVPPNDYGAAKKRSHQSRNIVVIDKMSESELRKKGGTIKGFQELRALYGATRLDPYGPFHQRGRSLGSLLTREQYEAERA